MTVEAIQIRTSDGLILEGEVRMPDGEPRAAAVICHPDPLHGGSKDHPLLWAIRAELANRGFAVVAFNFRGVMGSEGSHERGVGEVTDARAAMDAAIMRASGPLLLVGWSFGANVALRAAVDDPRVDALTLVGIPLADPTLGLPALPSNERLAGFERPVLLLSGDRDRFSPAGELRILGRTFADATVTVVAGTGHFFGRREREAAAIVGAFACDRLLPEGA